MEKFTEEQLMLFLHGEASPILQLAIEQTLKEDPELRKEMDMFRRGMKQLSELKKKSRSPGQASIDAILKYAKDGKK